LTKHDEEIWNEAGARAIYCRKHHNEKVSIKRVRELRIRIQNEARNLENDPSAPHDFKDQKNYAKT
jgi:hypothetical protein